MSENKNKKMKYRIVKSVSDRYKFRCPKTVYLYLGKYKEGRRMGTILTLCIIGASFICGGITGEVVFDTLVCALAFGSYPVGINLMSMMYDDTRGWHGNKQEVSKKYDSLKKIAGPTITLARYFELYFPFCLILAIPNMILRLLIPFLFISFGIFMKCNCEFLHHISEKGIYWKICIKGWVPHVFISGFALYLSMQNGFEYKVCLDVLVLIPALVIGMCISFFNKSYKVFRATHKATVRTSEFDILELVGYMDIVPRKISFSKYYEILEREKASLDKEKSNYPRNSWRREIPEAKIKEINDVLRKLDDLTLLLRYRSTYVNIEVNKLTTPREAKKKIEGVMTPEIVEEIRTLKESIERDRKQERERKRREYERERWMMKWASEREEERKREERKEKERLEELQRKKEQGKAEEISREDDEKIRQMESQKYNVEIQGGMRVSRGRGRR